MSQAAARCLRAALIAVATVVLALLTAAPAAAHSELIWTSPGAGQAYAETGPDALKLSFTEKVQAGLSSVRLLGPGGSQVQIGGAHHPENDGTTLETEVPAALTTGAYTVAWHVVSADGHPVEGAFGFTVGDASLGPVANAPHHGGGGISALVDLARWAGYVGYALLVGAAAFVVLCWPGGHRSTGLRVLARTGWAVAVVATTASLLLYGPYAAGRGLGAAFDGDLLSATMGSRDGKGLLVRAALLMLVAPLLGALLRHGRSRFGITVVLVMAGALACTWSATGHGGTDLRVAPIDVAHLVAMALWTGGLAALLVALAKHHQDNAVRDAVQAFSPVALACVMVLVATGGYQAWRQVRTVPALTDTDYGRLVTLKVAAVLTLLLLAAGARRWVRRHPVSVGRLPDMRGLRRAVGFEAAIAVAVLGVSAVLVGTEPARVAVAREPAAPAPATSAPPSAPPAALAAPARAVLAYDTGGAGGKGLVVVEVQPPRVGTAAVHLTAVDSTGRPLPVAELTLALALPAAGVTGLAVPLTVAGTGHYTGAMSLPTPGDWEVAVTVRTSDIDQSTSRATLSVTT